MKRTAAILICFAVAGCAMPTPQAQTGDTIAIPAGPAPSREVAIAKARQFLQRSLKDPDSMKQFEVVSGPNKRSWFRGWINGGGYEEGWLLCFEYNAKNSYGGYVGVKTSGLMMRQSGDDFFLIGGDWAGLPSGC